MTAINEEEIARIDAILADFEALGMRDSTWVPPAQSYEAAMKVAERAQAILDDDVRLARAAAECWPWPNPPMRRKMRQALMDECQAAIDKVCEWEDR